MSIDIINTSRLPLSKGNLIFCCTGSQENYFGLVGWQKIYNNPKFQGRHNLKLKKKKKK